MLEFLMKLFDSDFMPHGHCYFWQTEIVWLHVVSDGLIGLAYYAMSIALLYFARRRHDVSFHWMFLMFGSFIFACGTTHLMEVWTLWNPIYRLSGTIKLGTALVSSVTAILLVSLVPKALVILSPAQLEFANEELERQITQRLKAEEMLLALNENLERRVAERSAAAEERAQELSRLNKELEREITERKRAEEALAQRAEELVRSNAELEQFASVASHDLREPLRKITNYTELLGRRYEGQLDEKADRYISYIVGGATRMQTLITDLLTYSRVGRAGLTFQPTDVESILSRTLADLEVVIQENGAVVKSDSLPTVMANPSQMRQLLQNLISNAIKYRSEEPPHIHISAEQKGEEWVFSVQDNGIGIDPEYATRIFRIFQRLHTREEYPGTGIGLAVCTKIVESHGGSIGVESEIGKGSTFYFTIPVMKC